MAGMPIYPRLVNCRSSIGTAHERGGQGNDCAVVSVQVPDV